MVVWINYALGIEAFAIVLMIYGLLSFHNALKGLHQTLSYSLYFILATLALQIIQGATIIILLLNSAEYNNPLWIIYPSLALLGAYLLTVGSKRFLLALEGKQQN